MNYSLNLKAYFTVLPSSEMSGAQKYLAFAALLAGGKSDVRVAVGDVQRGWRRTVMKVGYNPSFYHRAQSKGWLDPQASGVFLVTESGLDQLSNLSSSSIDLVEGEMRQSGGLIVVNRNGAHTFDRYLRRVFTAAKVEVSVADSWVDETTFDNVLDLVPKSVPLKLIYARSCGTFEQRAKRFANEYPKFQFRRYKRLHDRFMIVDQKGYVLGPSIKDAASQSPALIVELAEKEKRLLRSFFEELWSATTIPAP